MNRKQFSVDGFTDEFRGKVDSVLNGFIFYFVGAPCRADRN